MGMINDVIELFEKLITIKSRARKEIFQEICKPMHSLLLEIHQDYIEHFMKMKELVPSKTSYSKNAISFSGKLDEAKTYILANRQKYLPHRARVREMMNRLSETDLGHEEKEFAQTSLDYLKLNINEALDLESFSSSELPDGGTIDRITITNATNSSVPRSALTELCGLLNSIDSDPAKILEYIDTTIRYKEGHWRFVSRDYSKLEILITRSYTG